MAAAARILLVHGASHGAWCWNRLMPLLEAAGHSVLAVDLPGRAGKGRAGWGLTLEHYIDELAAAVEREPEPVTLVGHSLAGFSLCGVAERLPERIRRLVFLSAWLPIEGRNMAELAKANIPSQLHGAVRASLLRGVVTVEAGRYHEVFCADASAVDAAAAAAQLVPESARTALARVKLSTERFGRVPLSYLCCEQDRALSPTLQRRMAAVIGCTDVRSLPSSHSPFLSMPAALAAELQAIVAQDAG